MLPVLCSITTARTMLRYFYRDFDGAVESAKAAEEAVGGVAGFVTPVLINFYQSLSLLAVAGKTEDADAKAEMVAKVDENLVTMRNWAEHQPFNIQHKLDLVLAERARVSGDSLEAIKLYEAAIAGARKEGFLHEEGLGCELAAGLHDAMGSEQIAGHYRTLAYGTYQRWGGGGKCAAMRAEYPELALAAPSKRARSGTLTSHTTSTTTQSGALDLLSVVKASQALAGEIVHANLLEKLMGIVMENVGAERGVLLLEREDGLFVEAQAAAGQAVDVAVVPVADYEQIPQSVVHYVQRTSKSIVLEDAGNDPRFTTDAFIAEHGPRSVLCAPIVHTGKLTGLFYFENNLATGVFTDDRLEVLSLLTAQVSISIENAKLYEQLEEHSRTLETKVEERTLELKEANGELRTSLDKIQTMQQQIIVQEKLASLGTLTAGIAHELQNPLNFVNNFSSVAVDLAGELGEVLGDLEGGGSKEDFDEARELVGELSATSTKVHGHGTRAASIIRNMLMHASNTRTEHAPCDLNEVVESSVTLAYHGVRAKNDDFRLEIVSDFDATVGDVKISRAEIARVLINVVNNACYATAQKAQSNGDGYAPTLEVSTRRNGDTVDIRLKDNGTGIPQSVLEKVLNPFFTTKPTGEGTGLGLSLSHDIVVQGHQGQFNVDTAEGEHTTFTISLPVSSDLDAPAAH